MALITLTNPISASQLDNNFGDKVSVLNGISQSRFIQYDIIREGVASGTGLGQRSLAFTAPDDAELVTMGLCCIEQASGAARTMTLTLSAVDSDELLISNDSDVSVAINALATFQALRINDLAKSVQPKPFLIKGAQYKLTLACSTATAVTFSHGFITCRAIRRR